MHAEEKAIISPPQWHRINQAGGSWNCPRCEALSTELKSLREEIGALTRRVQFLEEVNEAKDRELRDQVRQLCAMGDPVAGVGLMQEGTAALFQDGRVKTDGSSTQDLDVPAWNVMDIPDYNLLPAILTGLKGTFGSPPLRTSGQALGQMFQAP
ncbi:hypothetical protein KFL_010830020 [Klebsormidium nitens]|uniref:Uncharacterized protein n=1 Tax=Klebsormidium nitens TaxID=105231 RepID=A0A1Y1IP14_KLENI|nr:hypothetical protein KFL_010830020 [Klebsormidium nitens]|eukprot:GAQ92645.1 hypothetical protein KFL_010830020 [Klebsormidium nitens]